MASGSPADRRAKRSSSTEVILNKWATRGVRAERREDQEEWTTKREGRGRAGGDGAQSYVGAKTLWILDIGLTPGARPAVSGSASASSSFARNGSGGRPRVPRRAPAELDYHRKAARRATVGRHRPRGRASFATPEKSRSAGAGRPAWSPVAKDARCRQPPAQRGTVRNTRRATLEEREAPEARGLASACNAEPGTRAPFFSREGKQGSAPTTRTTRSISGVMDEALLRRRQGAIKTGVTVAFAIKRRAGALGRLRRGPGCTAPVFLHLLLLGTFLVPGSVIGLAENP